VIVTVVQVGDSLPDWFTAAGTFAAAVAAVGVAVWSDWRVRQERASASEREQFAQALTVEVAQGEQISGARDTVYNEPDGTQRVLVALVVNRSNYTITQVQARFRLSPDGANPSLVESHAERIANYDLVDEKLRHGLSGPPEGPADIAWLAPVDVGMRFESDDIPAGQVLGWYPVVRWTDRWGLGWEHRLGNVRRIAESEPWHA
jgi:hypothetical protein